MKKIFFGARATIVYNNGEKPVSLKCDIKNLYQLSESDCFLNVQPVKSKRDVYLNLNTVISISMLNNHEKKEKEIEDKAIC